MNYAIDGESIVFRTGEGTKLDTSRGGPACFEIDEVDPAERSGWSVVVRGNLHEVTAHDRLKLDRIEALADPWIGERPRVIELQSRSITGRRLPPQPPSFLDVDRFARCRSRGILIDVQMSMFPTFGPSGRPPEQADRAVPVRDVHLNTSDPTIRPARGGALRRVTPDRSEDDQ